MTDVWWKSKSCRLISMLVLTSSFFFVELIVGNITNSIALVADSFHMLSDIIALIVGLAAVLISEKQTPKNTFGWQRAEVLGALVNSVFLISLCFTIVVDSVQRFLVPEPVSDPKIVLIVGSVGFIINAFGLALLSSHGIGHGHSHGGGHGHSHGGHSHGGKSHGKEGKESVTSAGSTVSTIAEEGVEVRTANGDATPASAAEISVDVHTDVVDETDDFVNKSSAQLNMRGVFLHVLGDALGSVVVMISATIIWLVDGDWTLYIDPALSLLIVFIISLSTLPLLWQTSQILLLSIPRDLNMRELKLDILELPNVQNVHDVHLWQLSGDKNIFTAHVGFKSQEDYTQGERRIKDILHKKGIHSTTIQPEFELHERLSSAGSDEEDSCLLKCESVKCEPQTCCSRPQNGKTPSRPSSSTEAGASNKSFLKKSPFNFQRISDSSSTKEPSN